MRAAVLGAYLVGLLAVPAMADSADQFDLNCTGQSTAEPVTGDGSAPSIDKGPFPYTTHLRIDLAAQLYCQDDCKVPTKIATIAPDFIALKSNEGVTHTDELLLKRGDGSFRSSFSWDRRPEGMHGFLVMRFADGKCTKAPFSGMPKNGILTWSLARQQRQRPLHSRSGPLSAPACGYAVSIQSSSHSVKGHAG